MTYLITWVEKDKYGNKKASVEKMEDGKKLDVVLGKEWEDKEIMSGFQIDATEWVSPKNGKIYLFKPKETPKTASGGAFKQKMIEDTMNKKEASIGKFQDKKEESIRLASVLRDATLLTIAELGKDEGSAEIMAQKFHKWRAFLEKQWTEPSNPF